MRGWLLPALLCLPVATAAVEPLPAIVLIIDDMGDTAHAGERVVELPGPVVCAILPGAPHGKRLARRCHAAGKDVLLHLPMEAENGADPGPGAVTLAMLPDEFRATVNAALDALPHVQGVNNHMGSLLTQAPGPMTWLMDELRRRDEGLSFVDSRTTPRSVAAAVAGERGVPNLSRDVFLDNVRDESAICQRFLELVAVARREGEAVGIGHPYRETLRVLEDVLPTLEVSHGVRLQGLDEALGRD